MKITLYSLTFALFIFSQVNAGNHLINKEKLTKKSLSISNEESKKLGGGFVITSLFAINRSSSSGTYELNYVYDAKTVASNKYILDNAFGYNLGFGLGYQGRHYGFELPFNFNVDRFKVPSLSTAGLEVVSTEWGLCNYIKFAKDKHYINFGLYFLSGFGKFNNDDGIVDLSIGYGYTFTKRLNLSCRYKFDPDDIEGEGLYYSINAATGSAYNRSSAFNSLQLVLRYDLVNTRKEKSAKSNNANMINSNMNRNQNSPAGVNSLLKTAPNSTPPKTVIDYTSLSVTELQQALKAANNLDDMQSIQTELDKRKPAIEPAKSIVLNEFDNYTNLQLKELLDASVAKEDFERAEIIKNEIKNRKKMIEDLNIQLKEAVKAEDFDKAAQIQEKIKKLEK